MTKAINALGLEFDCRYGANAYILLKYDGSMREIVRSFDRNRPIDVVPKFLVAVKGVKPLSGMEDGAGRNSALFRHIIPLVHAGFSTSETRDILRLVNEFVFTESLPEEEMVKILRDEAFVKIKAVSIRPADFSDAGTAELFVSEYANKARFATSHGWLVWNGTVWEASELKAQQLQIELTSHMLKDAVSATKASIDAQVAGEEKVEAAAVKAYLKFVLRMREHSKVAGVLKLARSALEIKPGALDANPFEINTPSGIFCLRTGKQSPHRSEAFCTKITRFAPSSLVKV